MLCRVSTTAGAVAGGDLTIAAPDADPAQARAPAAAGPHARQPRPTRARALEGHSRGDHLLVLSGGPLERTLIGPDTEELPFRGVVIVSSIRSLSAAMACGAVATSGALQRALFDRWPRRDRRPVRTQGGGARCFLASDAVRSVRALGAGTRGHITMSSLGSNGRFRESIVPVCLLRDSMALRHGADRRGAAVGGAAALRSRRSALCWPRGSRALTFNGFERTRIAGCGRAAIRRSTLDLWGTSEIPECWRKHRPLLRRMFQLPRGQRRAIDAWRRRCDARRPSAARGDQRAPR